MSLILQISRSQDVTVIFCQGRIVFGEETTELCRSVRDRLPGEPHIVLDLHDVQHIDSGGLGALVGLVLAARNSGGDIKLCDPSSRVRNLLQITRLSTVIEVLPTQAQAVAGFRSSQVAA